MLSYTNILITTMTISLYQKCRPKNNNNKTIDVFNIMIKALLMPAISCTYKSSSIFYC